jgi:hypothetical protein
MLMRALTRTHCCMRAKSCIRTHGRYHNSQKATRKVAPHCFKISGAEIHIDAVAQMDTKRTALTVALVRAQMHTQNTFALQSVHVLMSRAMGHICTGTAHIYTEVSTLGSIRI